MTYELAKQLKDAGFPCSNMWQVINGKMWFEDCPVPTLSELIEACGDRFEGLSKDRASWNAYADCHGPYMEFDSIHEALGFTPEEAVAKLWLELQK